MPKTILIVDDEAALAKLTMLWIQSAGYAAVVAHDGQAGLAAAQAVRPDLILLDIMMPGLNGYEVSRALKQDPSLAQVPIIFLSAKVQETARREALEAGGKYFLSKPYEGTELLATVASALAEESGASEAIQGAAACN